ncbi:UbiC family transcriptional regulator [Fusobacterium hwasookii ChDC F174]|uniref:UbiC family transcriptional regulator n=1 Tax=Fusobacterium hwasookii ChDC F174 TaxID=1307442 RepID=A0A0S2ZLR3_9FUSO|nr:LeoA/HP0731 family dynamin-like GTPase [Fusobacterium hwasookii]ALQ39782.1 UbiC family transcriptional regulator [Fusobacterium hwasookii ChDC F174]
METLKVFNKKKEDVFKMLSKLLSVLKEGRELGVNIEPEYITKIEKSIDENEDKKLKVVLIGGFSEGKTSIAAAWLEEYDKKKMKIAMTESTDDIREYNVGNIHLVDTPGLFGFKETANKEKYKNITKKYISKANIVLYVMNSDNPIKESHKEEIQWLFKDLNLLPRTVFVLSRFDNVADIEDENDYNGMLDIKRENVLKRLEDFEVINAEDSKKIPIVAVAANPFDEGIEYWLEKLDEFKKLSHIDSLQHATSNIVEKNGGIDSVSLETQKSIIGEVLNLKIPLATAKIEKLDKEYKNLNNVLKEMEGELKNLENKISFAKIDLDDFIMGLFTDLILQLEGATIETFYDFFERNIGSEGIVLSSKIENGINKKVIEIENDICRLEKNFDNEIDNFEEFTQDNSLEKFKIGSEMMKNANLGLTNTSIIAVRNFLNLSIKFKPWQAVKIANAINKGIPIIGAILGIGLELWDSFSKSQQEKTFLKAKKQMKENFEKQRKEYKELIENVEEFDKNVFKSYFKLGDNIIKLSNELSEKEKEKEIFKNWMEKAKVIDNDLKAIKMNKE